MDRIRSNMGLIAKPFAAACIATLFAISLCSCAAPSPEFELAIFDEGEEKSDNERIIGSCFFQSTHGYSSFDDDGRPSSLQRSFTLTAGINASETPKTVTYTALNPNVSLSLPGSLPGNRITVDGNEAASGFSLIVTANASEEQLCDLPSNATITDADTTKVILSAFPDGFLTVAAEFEDGYQASCSYALAPYEENEYSITRYLLEKI